MRSTKAIIRLDNFKHNINEVKKLQPEGTKLCCAVKANAYGHGAVECAKAAVECGADFLAVAAADEGIELREAGINARILLLSLCNPEEVELCIKYGITPLVFDKEYVTLFQNKAEQMNVSGFRVQISTDTGMGRIGCRPEEAADLAEFICNCRNLSYEGIQTHCAASDGISKESREYTAEQIKRFTEAVNSIKEKGIDPGICHLANSAASLYLPEAKFNMVRPGIVLYGYYPDEITKEFLKEKGLEVNLKPVMTFESEVCAIKSVHKGESISYGMTWTAEKDTKIAILTAGYGDGIFRRFAAAGLEVAINGKNYPVRGRICMDQCMVEIGNESDVKRWDKAVFFGNAEDGALCDADELARRTGTISYEITTAVSKRVYRKYTE